MKAVDIAAKLSNWRDKDDDALESVMMDMMAETDTMIKHRKCHSNSAFEAVFKEQHQKWKAVCRRVPGLSIDFYSICVKAIYPKLWDNLQARGVFK